MNIKEFKSELETEMQKQGFMDDIYCITETTMPIEDSPIMQKQTIIQFSCPINPELAIWMDKWFPHGVTILSPTVVKINNEINPKAINNDFPDLMKQTENTSSAPASFETVMKLVDNSKIIKDMADVLSDILENPLKLYECEKSYQVMKTYQDAEMNVKDHNIIIRAKYYSNIVELIKKAKS